MRHHVRQLGLALLAVVLAVPVAAAQSIESGYIGKWKLNVAKSKFEPGPAPKSSVRTHEDRGGGLIVVWTEILTAQDKATSIAYAYKLDGKDYPQAQTGTDPGAWTIALAAGEANAVTFTTKYNGKVFGTGTRTISKDGKTMTIATKGLSMQGQPASMLQIWEKQP